MQRYDFIGTSTNLQWFHFQTIIHINKLLATKKAIFKGVRRLLKAQIPVFIVLDICEILPIFYILEILLKTKMVLRSSYLTQIAPIVVV